MIHETTLSPTSCGLSKRCVPAYFAFENVRGLTIGKQSQILNEMIDAFSPTYRVLLPYQVLNAADYDVPQVRRRLFLLGARKDLPLPKYPEPKDRRITVKEAIDDLPDPDMFEELKFRDWAVVKYGPPSVYAQRLRCLVKDPKDFSYKRLFNESLLTASLRTAHAEKIQKRFKETKPGKTEPISRLFRLDLEGQCNTIRSGTASDRGALTSPRPIHPRSPRVITNREAARLHSFPDWVSVYTSRNGTVFGKSEIQSPPLLGQNDSRRNYGCSRP